MRSTNSKSALEHLKSTNFYHIVKEKEPAPEPESKRRAPGWVAQAVLPIITQECFAQTMQRYRVFISAYNKWVIEYNEAVQWHNAGVDLHAELEGHTDIEKQYQILYERRYDKLKREGELNIREYNDEVEKVCLQHGYHFLKKKTLPTVKHNTEMFFQNLLHVYNTQLEKKNNYKLTANISLKKEPLRPLEVNSHFITKLMREGVISLDVCARTVRNHRIRLEEAGVLMGTEFRGRQRGVHTYFNPEILAILDAYTEKPALAENHAVNQNSGKVFPDNNEITRPIYRDSIDKRDDATQSSVDKVSAEPTAFGYKTILQDHQVQGQENSPGAAPQNVKVSPPVAETLMKTVLPIPQFDEKMRTGEFDNYIPLSKEALRPERNLMLSDEEYQQVVIQDCLKIAAKMYRGRTDVKPGTWANTLKHWIEYRFRGKKVWSKEQIYEEIDQVRYRISTAHRWFMSRKMQPLYPSRYFDVTRTGKDEFGFEYTKKFWLEYQQREKDRPQRLEKQAAIAEARKKEKLLARRYRYKVNAFINGKCDIDQLVHYVKKNLPAAYFAQLGLFIQKHVADENHRSQYTA